MAKNWLTRSVVCAVLLFVVGEIIFLSLARWQWHRMLEKETLYTQALTLLNTPPVALTPESFVTPGQPVRLQGQPDPSRLRLLDNQPLEDGRVGMRLLVPLVYAPSYEIVADLGWLPRSYEPGYASNLAQQLPKQVAFNGVVQAFRVPAGWLPAPVAGVNEHIISLPTFTAVPLPAAGVERHVHYVQASTPVVEGVLATVPLPVRGNKHLEYTLTWLAFAAVLFGMFVWVAVKRINR